MSFTAPTRSRRCRGDKSWPAADTAVQMRHDAPIAAPVRDKRHFRTSAPP
jgi:hypothetical protein